MSFFHSQISIPADKNLVLVTNSQKVDHPLHVSCSNRSGQATGVIDSIEERIHAKAIEVSTRYKRAEAELVDVLIEVEDRRVFLKRGHSSLFKYVILELGLSENTAYSLITVARKARQIPALKTQIQSGEMTLSNARRVASVLTAQNQEEWISKACELSSRQLEKEIVKVKPSEATSERASYVASDRVKLEIGLSEREMLRLRRVQDLVSQSHQRAVSLEVVIHELNNLYLHKHDPVEKAKRHHVKKPVGSGLANRQSNPSKVQTETVKTLVTKRVPLATKRVSLSATIKHQVNLRDQRRCTHTMSDGLRCNQSRFVEIHHKVPVSQGGRNEIDNLITLCSAHHRLIHNFQ